MNLVRICVIQIGITRNAEGDCDGIFNPLFVLLLSELITLTKISHPEILVEIERAVMTSTCTPSSV